MNSHTQTLSPTTRTKLRKFFAKLKFAAKDDSGKSLPDILSNNVTFISEDKHSIRFTDEDSINYSKLQDELALIHSKSRTYGRTYAENILKDVIWQVLDSSEDPGRAARQAVATIESKLNIPFQKWSVYFPVDGLSLLKSEPWVFGQVKFISTDPEILSNELASARLSESELLTMHQAVGALAKVEILAIDSDTAIAEGANIVNLTVSVVNCYGNLVGGSRDGKVLSSYDQVGSEKIASIIFIGEKTTGFKRSFSYKATGINTHLFLQQQGFVERFDLAKIDKALRSPIKNGFVEMRIIPAMKWVGKATAQTQPDEAYLNYCIALESLIYNKKHSQDSIVTKELKTRLYLLLFSNEGYFGSSISGINRFDHLYDLRSRIVHRGKAEVTDSDLETIRSLTYNALHKTLNESPIKDFETEEAFESWLTRDEL